MFLGFIATAFWYQDWQYSLPVARPADLYQPAIGSRVSLRHLGFSTNTNQPVFLHFFNPDCPCSRFNLDHIRELIRRHRNDVRFVAVLQGDKPTADLQQAFDDLELGVDSIVDTSGELGRVMGVYATPQAVLIDGKGRLYYRGNYNLARYCADPATEYARIALEAMLAGKSPSPMPDGVNAALGCPLPKRKQGAQRAL
ncbi:MAG: TlpA family protein disulfide reductase [Acidobacteria bacterium]|nr:TlpA family protein disulfide reductase [Acidobacteriota bacterium]